MSAPVAGTADPGKTEIIPANRHHPAVAGLQDFA
jgi:hypothetical protein